MSDNSKYNDAGMLIPGAPKLRAKLMIENFNFQELGSNITDSLGLVPGLAHDVVYDPHDQQNHHLLDEWKTGLSKAKLWPTPSYSKMIERGVPAPAVATLKYLRDTLPTEAFRPTPTNLVTFAEAIIAARAWAEEYSTYWEQVAEKRPNWEASHHTIGQTAAYITSQTLRVSDSSLYPMVTAPELSEYDLTVLQQGLDQCPSAEKAFDEIRQKLETYYQCENSLRFPFGRGTPGSRVFNSLHKAKRDLSKLHGQVTKHPVMPFSIQAERPIQRVNNNQTKILADHLSGYYFSPFSLLKIKPDALPLPTYDPPAEAAARLAENKAEPKVKKASRPPRLTESEAKALLRAPEDDGESSDQYQSLDGLIDMGLVRGIQWGEWVPQKERPTLVKNIVKGFGDFAAGNQVTPSLAGLGNPVTDEQRKQVREDGLFESAFTGNESIGLALGARGKSSAAAHYEPGLHAINLTRFNGAGALAHELYHGLDKKLSSLVDISKANRHYGSADIRKATGSRNGITYFSELVACQWWRETVFTNRKRNVKIPKEDLDQACKDHIEEFLTLEVKSNKELMNSVMPLLIGVSRFVQEMYYRVLEPEEMLKESASSFLIGFPVPNKENNELNSDLKLITANLSSLLPNTYKYFAVDLADKLTSHFLTIHPSSPGKEGTPIHNWIGSPAQQVLLSIKSVLRSESGKHLETLIGQDLKNEDRSLISDSLACAFNASVLHAVVYEEALYRLRDLDMPPHPDEAKHAQTRLKDAVYDVINDAPIEFLQDLRNSQREFDKYPEFRTKIQKLEPTSDGILSGINAINAEVAAPEWSKFTVQITNAITAGKRSRWIRDFTPLRVVCDARKQPPQKKMQRIHEQALDGLSHYREVVFNYLKNSPNLFLSEHAQTRLMRKVLPEDGEVSPKEWASKLASATNEEPFRNFMMSEDYQSAVLAMIGHSYSNSPLLDEQFSTFAKVLNDPTLLGEHCPPGLTVVFGIMNRMGLLQTKQDVSDWSTDTNIRLGMANLNAIPFSKAIFERADTFAREAEGAPSAKNRSIPYITSHLVSDVMMRAVRDGNLNGVHELDSAIDNIGASFRYLPSEERLDIIASFYDHMKDELVNKLSPENFHAKLTAGTNRKIKRFGELELDDIADNWIEHSHQLVTEERSNTDLRHFYVNLESAKADMENLNCNQRDLSNVLKHSMSYEAITFHKDGFIKPDSKKGYWYSAREMFARCAEAALSDTLDDKGISSPYLVTVPKAHHQRLPQGNRSYPGMDVALNYPADVERRKFANIFQTKIAPNMEEALNAMFPDAKPAYEAYMSRKTSLANRNSMLESMDMPSSSSFDFNNAGQPSNDEVTTVSPEHLVANANAKLDQEPEPTPATQSADFSEEAHKAAESLEDPAGNTKPGSVNGESPPNKDKTKYRSQEPTTLSLF